MILLLIIMYRFFTRIPFLIIMYRFFTRILFLIIMYRFFTRILFLIIMSLFSCIVLFCPKVYEVIFADFTVFAIFLPNSIYRLQVLHTLWTFMFACLNHF